jgi:membrane fusion protein (multidrug efflux system)
VEPYLATRRQPAVLVDFGDPTRVPSRTLQRQALQVACIQTFRELIVNQIVLSLVSAAALAVALAGCDKPAAQQTAQMPPPEVNVVTVQPRDLPVTFEYVGQTAGVREVEVRPRVTGILQHWNYREGGAVRAGESLFTIDPAPFQATVARAEGQLGSAEARLAQAERNVMRLKPLFEAKATSQREYDDAVSAQQIASADVNAAKAQVTQARLDLQYTRVEAPISGISGRALKSEGSLVDAQQTLLTTITQIDPIHVIFSFTEAENLKFQRAVAEGRLVLPKDGRFDVKLKLADGSEYARAGKVDFTDVRVNPTTGTIEERAVISNPQQLLRPGQFVRVQLSGAVRPAALAIPQRAVLEGPNAKIVLTVNAQGVVEPRPIQVGDWAGEDWVIEGGLKPGDRVIVDGMVKARPGSPVKIADAGAAGAPPPGTKPAPPGAASTSSGPVKAAPSADAGKPSKPAQ